MNLKQTLLIDFQAMVDEIAKGVNPSLVFYKLKNLQLSRVELMIIDSAIKHVPLEYLYNTLLLSEAEYYQMIHNVTNRLIELFISETHIDPNSSHN